MLNVLRFIDKFLASRYLPQRSGVYYVNKCVSVFMPYNKPGVLISMLVDPVRIMAFDQGARGLGTPRRIRQIILTCHSLPLMGVATACSYGWVCTPDGYVSYRIPKWVMAYCRWRLK